MPDTLTREESAHLANHPDRWAVVKAAPACWQVRDARGAVTSTHGTRTAAEAELADGWAVRLWHDTLAWMHGDEAVRIRQHWRPFADIVADRERFEARTGRPAPWL